jgi:phage baseplate assembly protein gpV
MPEGKQHKVERDVFYRVRKTFHELDAEKPGKRASSYVTYMIESLQYYALGDLITLPIGQGKELVVVRAVTTLTDGLLRTRYDLQAEQDIHYARYENDQATGISLTGTVLKVQQDFVQLQLDIDPKQDPAKAYWFPVATRYVAEEHSGWYDMPEIGEKVELYLPTHREQDAYVTDSLRQQRHTNGQPNVKVWQHVQGSGVEMSEHELTLSTSGEFSITLHESSGITIDSPGNVQIQGGHVKLDAGQELSLEAGTALYLKGGSSSMVLDGETDTKAPVIYQEGTVKAPVFVADLPPVPEPPLMSIKAYEAAQAPSATKTSSSTPTAKVTSPAALQQANSLLGTVSKLLGSIPVMGKVAGVVAGALGGPAVGVILKATAMIPVRSKGTPTIGGGKGNGTHPLKHLAGLALQGLINKYEHDQARQAYYSKWILGKVFTSARHIAHSGGPLELVQNLLKESNAMVHAYQQIPVDLRQRWRANYDSYMAAEKAKVSYNFDEYDKKFMGTMWVLSKNGVTDQKAAQATLAYNEAIKNGEIKLHREPENVDIFVEQIKAAKEGKNYWTGEEIPKWQANAIIISSVFSEFQMVGSLYGAKFGRNIKIPSKSIKAPVSIVEEPGIVKPPPSKPIEPPKTEGTIIGKPKLPSDKKLLEAITDWSSMQKKLAPSKRKMDNFNTAAVAYDAKTGKYYYGMNKGIQLSGDKKNTVLFGSKDKAGLLPKDSLNEYAVGNCAEVDAVNQALNQKANVNDLYIYTIKTTPHEFGAAKIACENCTFTFKGNVADALTGWYKGD